MRLILAGKMCAEVAMFTGLWDYSSVVRPAGGWHAKSSHVLVWLSTKLWHNSWWWVGLHARGLSMLRVPDQFRRLPPARDKCSTQEAALLLPRRSWQILDRITARLVGAWMSQLVLCLGQCAVLRGTCKYACRHQVTSVWHIHHARTRLHAYGHLSFTEQ
jgi:hypothetical protein